MFDNELRRALQLKRQRNRLVNEIAQLLGVDATEFRQQFYEWIGTMPLSDLDGLEYCRIRAARGSPMPWQRT